MNEMPNAKRTAAANCNQSVQFRKIVETHGNCVLLPPGRILVDPNQSDQNFYYILKGKL